MVARGAVLALVLAVVAGLPVGAASVDGADELVLKRDEDYTEIVAMDPDGDTTTG